MKIFIKNTFFQIITPFFFGILLVSSLMILLNIFPILNQPNYGTTYGPFLEEILKYLTALFLIRFLKLKWLLVSIPLIGIGWGWVEVGNYLPVHGGISFIMLLVHASFGIFMALFINKALKKNGSIKYFYYTLALIIPALIHFGYNNLVFNL